MKVIVNDKVYVQVRDILFLARTYKVKNLMDYYLFLINQGHLDTDFIRSTNVLLNKVLKRDVIIDFRDYQDYSDLHLGNLIIALASVNQGNNEVLEHKLDDLRDIISLKRNELNYSIPLIPDDKVDLSFADLQLSFKSTIFSNYYLIEAKEDISNYKYLEALQRGIKVLQTKGLIEDDVSYELINKGSYMVVSFNDKKNKKERVIDRVVKKFKRNKKEDLTM